MKRPILLSLIVTLGFASGLAMASPQDGNRAVNRVIPVLLNINTKGKVTEVNPGYRLRPNFKQFLNGQLKKIAVKPAMEKGKPVSRQYLLMLALKAAPREGDNYSVNLKLLSSKALPIGLGPWHWVHGDGHHLALASPSQPKFSLSGPSWTQKMKALNAVMGFHASDPLMR
jgi:hypothetical protein